MGDGEQWDLHSWHVRPEAHSATVAKANRTKRPDSIAFGDIANGAARLLRLIDTGKVAMIYNRVRAHVGDGELRHDSIAIGHSRCHRVSYKLQLYVRP
eukprot:SAG31_NODE_3643_length_4030_cov_3.758586_2_plen_98_part_00